MLNLSWNLILLKLWYSTSNLNHLNYIKSILTLKQTSDFIYFDRKDSTVNMNSEYRQLYHLGIFPTPSHSRSCFYCRMQNYQRQRDLRESHGYLRKLLDPIEYDYTLRPVPRPKFSKIWIYCPQICARDTLGYVSW